jgi:hypothetical protein
LVIIDLDGPDGIRRYGELVHEIGAPGCEGCPDGASVQSGRPEKGLHLYFRTPSEAVIPSGKIAGCAKLECRASTGYIVAPPSVDPSGAAYRWLDRVPADGLPVLAPRWVELLSHRSEEEVERPPVHLTPIYDVYHGTRYGQEAVAGLLRAVAHAQEGGRRKAVWAATRRVHERHDDGHVPDPAPLLELIREYAGRTELPEDEITSTIAAATGAATGTPREATYA